MMRFERVAEPDGFSAKRDQGNQWLVKNASGRPPDRWSAFRSHLAAGFKDLCGYSAMYEPSGTIDHFVSCNEDRSRAYDWTNYRYIAGWLNASKQDLRSVEVLDPFEVSDDWFEIDLPSMQLMMTDAVPEAMRARANLMLTRLHLGDDERIVRQRHAWYRRYQSGKLPFEMLVEFAPLIARAVAKQQGGV